MKKKLGLCLAVCGLLFASGCGLGEPKEFTSPDGSFKAMMPGSPKKQTQSAQGITFHMFICESGKDGMAIGYADMPIPPGEPENVVQDRLDGAARGMVGAVSGNTRSVNRITLAGKHPGREVEADVPSKSAVFKARVYLVGTRLYQVIIVGNSSWVNSETAKKCLESFQLTQ